MSERPYRLELVVSKFPAFNPEWDDAAKGNWFLAFARLCDLIQRWPEYAESLSPEAEEVAGWKVQG